MMHPERTIREDETWREHSTGFGSVSVFLTNAEGKLLMVQDLDKFGGKWSPVAGYIDDLDHEEPEMTALREAKEEMGLDIRLDELLGVWHYYDKSADHTDKVHMHVGYAYTGTILGGTYKMQKEEIQHYGFFSPEDVETMHDKGLLKTPQYNYVGFKLWESGKRYPRTLIQTNGVSHDRPYRKS